MNKYQLTERNKVKRVPNRGFYDKGTVYDILDAGFLCHISFVVQGQPFIIPTLYGRKDDTIFIHGASSSRMIKNLEKGIPMNLAVTHVDALVLARSAFHHSANYRSVVIFGNAKEVLEDKKEEALLIISENIIKGRWEEVRSPNRKELKATTILAINIDQASAKIRTGPAKDDAEDYELDIWAGILPISITVGEPIADELMDQNIKIPRSVLNYVKIAKK